MPSNLVRPRVHAVFVFAAFIVGCVTSQVVAPLLVPAVRAGTNPTRWEYLCTEFHALNYLQSVANKVGAEGWELTTAGGPGTGNTPLNLVWCFKRPRP
jgi:hypothetical protein